MSERVCGRRRAVAAGADNRGLRAVAVRALIESLELRRLLSAAADVTDLTVLRNDANYDEVDGSGIGVAVIDTGTFAAHPDLRDNFVVYFDAIRNRSGRPGNTDVSAARDPDGHGTHVAGIALSSNPEIGVAPAADLVAIRALPDGSDALPQFDPVTNALEWVLDNYQQYNIKVVNMSLGDYATNLNRLPGGARPEIYDQLERLGITTVIASGNNWGNFAPTPGATNPGVYGTLTVASTWPDSGAGLSFPQLGGNGERIRYISGEGDAAPDRFSATSQRSTLPNQVAAPGSGINSTWNEPDKPYTRLSGTSMATPFVSGTVALMQDAAITYGGRYLTPAEVQRIVRESADTIADTDVASNFRIPIAFDRTGRPVRTGPNQNLPETGLNYERVNVYEAVRATRQLVTGTTPDPDPEPQPTPGDQGDTNNTIAAATALPGLNGTRRFVTSNKIGADGSVQTGGDDVDLYKIVLDSPGRATFATDPVAGGQNFTTRLRLFDSAGALITATTDAQPAYPTLRSERLAAGTYYLGVSAAGNTAYDITTGGGTAIGQGTGDYTLTITLGNPDPNGIVQGAEAVDLRNPNVISPSTDLPATLFVGVIDSDPNPLDPDGERTQIGPTDVDMFQVIAPDTGKLIIDVDALGSTAHPLDGVDSYVRVFDTAVREIAHNDDVGTNVDSYLEVNVTAGETYYVAVTTFGNRNFDPQDPFNRSSTTNATGEYDLYLSFDNGDVNGTVFEASDMRIGDTAEGDVGADRGSPLTGINGGSKDVDFFRFTAGLGTSGLLDVSAASPDASLEPVLGLWQFSEEQGDVVKVFDTAGQDARIIVPIASGEELYVSVTGAGNNDFNWFAPASGSGGDTGAYRLTSGLRATSALRELTDNSIQNHTPEPIAPGERLYREIGADGGVAVGAADVDLFRFTATTTGQVTFRAAAPGEQGTDPFLRVFDSRGSELARNDDAGAAGLDAAITLSVVTGQVYYVGVNGSSDDAGNYDPRSGTRAAPGDGGDYVLEASEITPGNANLPFSATTRAVWTDADGSVVTVSLRGPGSGTVEFASGANASRNASAIVLDGATAATTVSVGVRNGQTTVGAVSVNGGLRSLSARAVDVNGDVAVSGTLGKLQLDDVSNGTLRVGPGGATSLTLASATNYNIDSGSAFSSLKVGRWTDDDAAPDTIAAPLVTSLSVSGDFGADLSTASVGRARVGGAVTGSTWRLAEFLGTVSAGAVRDSRILVAVTDAAFEAGTLPDAPDDFTNAAATFRSLSIRGRSGGGATFSNAQIAAPNIGRASLGTVAATNGGTTFGLAADFIDSVSGTAEGSGPFRESDLADPSQSILLGDAVVRVL